MLKAERQALIVDTMRERRFMTVQEIIDLTGTSLATVCRDLLELADAHRLRRVRGGAEFIQDGTMEMMRQLTGTPFDSSRQIRRDQKQRIATAAVDMLKDGETVIIDGGSTTYEMVRPLLSRRVNVITNSLAVAETLYKNSSNRVTVPGGEIFPEQHIILNPFEDRIFKDYFADKVFMGAQGVGPEGVTNSDSLLIRTQQAMLDCGGEIVLLVDSSKFGRHGKLRLCGLDRIDVVITDTDASPEMLTMMQEADIKVITV
jgi:DeoR family ulaG and ulaABCDEF operon transcriptional repressor